MIGKALGHYRVGEQLGRGGMGEVYPADDPLELSSEVSSQTWDVTPDGNRFLLAVSIDEGSAAPFNVILNWTTPLKK